MEGSHGQYFKHQNGEKMKFLITLLALIPIYSLSTPCFADISSNEYAKCSSIKGDLSRLDCFDKLAKKKKLNKPHTLISNVKGKGKWAVSVKQNPIDDSKSVTLLLDAESGESKWGKKVYLVIRCNSNKTEMYISWQDYLGNKANVLTRVGTNKARTKEWSLSTNSQSTFYPKGTISFIKKMMTANKLLAQVTPYNENPTTAIFDTKGLVNAIKPLRETCHW